VDGAARAEKCVDRLVSRATLGDASLREVRLYARNAYCSRFARNGWVYEDGALSIAAQKWLESGYRQSCVTSATGGEPSQTVTCEEDGPIDCALLHFVRRSEVRDYIEELRQRNDEVSCDDGTPVEELGVP
jgi:hypothetical protein